MIVFDNRLLLFALLVFCRIGGGIMVMPGISSPRVPAQVRLFIAIAVSLALLPLLLGDLQDRIPAQAGITEIVAMIVTESIIGVSIGLLGRFFFLALQFMTVAVASFIGLAGMAGVSVDDGDQAPAVASLVTLTATALFFVADLHWEVFRGIIGSYEALPVGAPLDVGISLEKLVEVLAQTFHLALQITSPFVIFSITITFTFGVINKLTPQIPVYFISMPFIIAGGMLLLYLSTAQFLEIFLRVLGVSLEQG